LKIDALKLIDGPIAVELDESVHVLEVEDDPVYQFLEGMRGRVVFTRMADGQVLVRGTLITEVRAACVRCLEPVDVELTTKVTLVYANEPDLLDANRRLEYPDEMLYYDGHVIEPLSDLRELLLLELPPYPNCSLVRGQICLREGLQAAPIAFGEGGEHTASGAPPAENPGREEPEWKRTLREVSAARAPKKS